MGLHRKPASAFLLLVCVGCFTRDALAQRPIEQPELLAGPWEAGTVARTDGVFLKVNTHVNGSADKPVITNQTIQVRVYHRDHNGDSWGWFETDPYGPHADLAAFDGHRLRVRHRFTMDVIFDPAMRRWAGTWTRDGETRPVVLERPTPPPGTLNAFGGDWKGLPAIGGAAGSLHIMQSADGTVTAWLDRFIDVIDQRHGEWLRVSSVEGDVVVLELVSAGAPQWRYFGRLSADGSRLEGRWGTDNANDILAALARGAGGLNAPTVFVRVR
jgi:hypothetical protein